MHPFKNEGENDADKGHQGTKKGNAQRSLLLYKNRRADTTALLFFTCKRTKKDRLRADILLIAALLALALGFFALQRLSRKDGALAVVYVNGERTAEYPLAEDTTVTLHAPNGGYNILVISGGTADVTEASCPDGICVRAKGAQYEGDTIVCLPNKTEIRIEGAASADIDLVS